MVDSFEVTNVDFIVTCVSQKFTHEIRNRWRLLVSVGFSQFDMTGNLSQF